MKTHTHTQWQTKQTNLKNRPFSSYHTRQIAIFYVHTCFQHSQISLQVSEKWWEKKPYSPTNTHTIIRIWCTIKSSDELATDYISACYFVASFPILFFSFSVIFHHYSPPLTWHWMEIFFRKWCRLHDTIWSCTFVNWRWNLA